MGCFGLYTHLIGTHNVKITDNMLTLPDNFISVFNGKCVLSRSFDECMMIYPISVWNDFAESAKVGQSAMQTNKMFLYIQEITMKSTWQFGT